jgi:hypothetical protein
MTYQKGSVFQNLDHTSVTALLSSSDSNCPINSFSIITDQTLGTLLGGSPITADASNVITDTTNSFNTPLWLRVSTIGGAYYDIPINIYVCGFETINASSTPSALAITY